jgi:hypothetical protein
LSIIDVLRGRRFEARMSLSQQTGQICICRSSGSISQAFQIVSNELK